MGFPHLPRPPEPSLELWLWQFFFRNLPAGQTFSSKHIQILDESARDPFSAAPNKLEKQWRTPVLHPENPQGTVL